MNLVSTTPSRIIAAGIILVLVITLGFFWVTQDSQPYDEFRYFEPGGVSFTDHGSRVAELVVHPLPRSDLAHAVPFWAIFCVDTSRYRVDSAEIRITREVMGDIYFRGYQKEFPSAQFWRGNDGRSGTIRLETPGWWGESCQGFDFLIPLDNVTETVSVDLDARISETGPFWRHSRIQYRMPVSVNLTSAGIHDTNPN
jgi:hypothetical protein